VDCVPTVGVVIPVYRCADYVRGCLESVLAQTHPVSEIVLVDDRGGDDSVPVAQQVLAAHGRPYTLVTQPENGGLGRARNAGLAALGTDLVWFLDSDDQAEPRFVERLLAALTHGGADFAVCRTARVDEAGRVLQIDEAPAPSSLVPGRVYARELLCGRAKAYACTKLYRRAVLGDRPWAEDQAYEDLLPSLTMALDADRVALIDQPLYRYLYREGSLSTALSEQTFDLFVVARQVRELLAGTDPGWQRDYLAFWYRQVLTSVAHVAMRVHHAQGRKPALYDRALREVRAGISLRDVPTLLAGRRFREAIFAVLVKLNPGLYSAVLRWR